MPFARNRWHFRRHAARDNGKEKKLEGGFAIDLAEVTLVSREAIRSLSLVEPDGVELQNCPAYVREWISREREDALSE